MTSVSPVTDPAEPGLRPAQPSALRSRLVGLVRWETLLAILLVVLIWIGSVVAPGFLTSGNFTILTSNTMEVAIMALPMAMIVIVGEIDLSVESMAGLAVAVLGLLFAAGVPLLVCIPVVIGLGAVCGLLNGLLVARAALPSLVVTIGTLALFRGLAQVVLGTRGISDFPDWYTEFGFGTVPGTPIPWPLVVFSVLAVIFGLVLHGTWVGRQVYATGKNQGASRYSGVRVARMKTGLFVVSGMMAALAGVVLSARLASARADAGQGLTLTVVTVVLLGGVNIFGGSGTIPGVVLAVFTLAVLESALRLAHVSAELQSIAIGLLLIISVVIPSLARQAREAIARMRSGRPPPAGARIDEAVSTP